MAKDRSLAIRTISWISYAQRPLITQELCHALAIERGDKALNSDNIYDVKDIISVCAGLVTVDEKSNVIRLIHYTTQNYFERIRLNWSPGAREEIATTCLTYIAFDTFRSGSCSSDENFEKRMKENAFLSYAARHWADHVRPVEATVSKLALAFLQDNALVSSSTQVLLAGGKSTSFPIINTGLHLSARFGLVLLSRLLLTAGGKDFSNDINSKNSYNGQTPLSLAAAEGHEAVVKLLIDTGKADIDFEDSLSETPLALAAAEGHKNVVKLLIDTGKADVDFKNYIGQTPLALAAAEGHEDIVKLLIDTGKVDVDSRSSLGLTPLALAAGGGHENIVKLLIDTEADVNSEDSLSETPLALAAAEGHKNVVKLLIDTGKVDVDFKDMLNETPLALAAAKGHENIVKLLISTGKADVVQTGDATAAKHEARWDEDSDSLSGLSVVSSVQSLPSLVSNSLSASIRDKYGSKAAEHLAALLLEDSVLTSIYEAAIVKFGRKRFHQNHDQLLKAFFKDLRSETQNSVQLATVRSLRSRDRRHKITSLIYSACEPLNIHKQQVMTVLRGQKPNRKQLLDNYLREKTSALQIDSLTSLVTDLKQSNVTAPEQDDESVDEETNSNSSSGNDDRLLDQDNKETYVYFEPLETYITKGNAFARFKTNFGYYLQPPTDISEALKSRDIHIVQRFLARNFASAATSGYEWLHELDEAGHSKREIAELLLEDICDSPWIYYTPQPRARNRIQTIFHVPGCAHQASSNTKPQSFLYSEQVQSRSLPLHTNVRRQVEELCGVGGVVPSSRDVSTWDGSVTFQDKSSVSVITYAATSGTVRQSRNDLAFRISNVLANFCAAAAAVQSSGLCCDSFTVLLCIQDCLELRRIELQHAMRMASYIQLAVQGDNSAIGLCTQSAESILQELRVSIPKTTPNADLHYCALAAQFLCAAFLSYIQAHVGSVDPFFLDTPQRKMVLLGSQRVSGDFAINAELVELTCLAEMTRQLVLAFSSGSTSRELCLENGTSRYDVLTNAEDFLDTWGPGYFIHNKASPSKIHAIAICGGFVSLVDSKTSRFHWAKGTLAESALQAAFEPHTIMRVGAAVSINENCCIDEAACRESSFCALEPLGTHEVFWEAQGRQAGFQGGQYLAGTYSQTWKKIPGITLKERKLEQPNCRLIHFLEQNWGLQVSFCTSVARRVSLRELVTDLLPMFINPLKQDAWQELVNDHNIIHAFTQGNLFTWLCTLSPFLRDYVLTLVRTILEQLQHTGLDRQNTTLIIAWPQDGDVERGLKIPCRAQTCWAQVIADAEDCATFAYVTPKCLETNQVKCRGSLRAWQNTSKMLVTEMSPSRPEGQLAATNDAVTTTPVSVMTTTARATTQWELEDKKTYYIKKRDSLLQVKVERPSSAISDVAHLVVASSDIPRALWKRLLVREEERRNHRIRERQAMGDYAECVIIRARLIGA